MKEDIVHFYIKQTKTPFYLEMAGVSYCDKTYSMSRKYSTETVIEYVVKGKGYVNIDNETHTVTAGQVYILRQKTTHRYWADEKEPWVKIFFNIRGTLAEKILDEYKLGINRKIVLCGAGLEKDFRNMLDTLSENSLRQSQRFELAALEFLQIIIKLSNLNKEDTSNEQSESEQEMNRLIEYIYMNQKRIISNQELADVIFRSKDYVIKKFHESFGVTPYEYQIRQKMIEASNLLTNSKLSVKDIASSIGYDDPHYFSNLFKKRCGLTPMQYRKKRSAR